MMKANHRLITALLALLVICASPAFAGAPPSPTDAKTGAAKNFSIRLYNFRKHRRVLIADPRKLTAAQAAKFLPATPDIQKLYRLYVKKGQLPFAALANTYTDILQAYKAVAKAKGGRVPSSGSH